MTPLHPVSDTGLAAALATLGIPLDPDQGITRVVDTISGTERVRFMFHDGTRFPEGTENHKTELVVGMWLRREQFEGEHPGHPLVAMRAALDARRYLLGVVNGTAQLLPSDFRGERYHVGHLWEAAVLKAHGFPLLMTTGREYSFPNAWKGSYARQIIERSQRTEGKSAPQWMMKFLLNHSQFLGAAKAAVPVLIEKDEDKTLLLSADASPKLRGQMQDEFAKL